MILFLKYARTTLAIGGLFAVAAPTLAQDCLGDADGSGDVTVDEIITVVNNGLVGCAGGPVTEQDVIDNYAAILYANYSDALAGAERLAAAIDELVANPQQVTLDAAKAAWLASRPAYLQTEMARFYEGPIDNEDSGPEGQINAWPLDESYVDYVEGNSGAGVINMVGEFPDLSKELIAGLNEQGSETNIASGYHAIEFLLWGQDGNDDGPGNRPYTDYVTDGSGTAANQDRRGTYLKLVAELLVDDLRSVTIQWAPASDNFRAEFVSQDPKVALGQIMTGIGTLSGFELSNERMAVALETQDQEDEHSCFSDNTHVDHRNDQLGIQNAYLGRYGSIDGPGLHDLLLAVNPTLAAELEAAIQETIDRIHGIPVPFDQAVQGADTEPGRQAIIASVEALRAQTSLIEDAALALGVDISTN